MRSMRRETLHTLCPRFGRCWLLALSLMVATPTAATANAPGAGKPAHSKQDRSYDDLTTDAKRLAAALGMPSDRRDAALSRLNKALVSGRVAAFAKDASINGVFAYQTGEGGFLVKVRKGKGLVHILGQKQDLAITLKSVTFGAQIGGGSEWGFGLVLGLRDASSFGGEYSGNNRGATAAEESISLTKLTKRGVGESEPAYHELYMLGVAAGLSAGAAIGSLNIAVQGPG